MTPSKFSTLIAVALLPIQVFCQHTTHALDSLTSQLVQHIKTDGRQRVIVQTDRTVYAPGERIWFNAVVVNKETNRLSNASKNLMVDLVNDKDSVIAQAVLNAAAFNTNGALSIGPTVENGYYWLRGYTHKILRDNLNGLYLHPIYIINKNTANTPRGYDRAATPKPVAQNSRPVLQFFPEGGTLATGIQCAVVVKATDSNGNPLTVAGQVQNEADSTIASFATNKFGLARVNFYPEGNHAYAATLQQGGGAKYPLPAFNPYAGQIAVKSQTNEWINAVVTLEDSIYAKTATTYLLGVSGDSVCFAAVGKGMYSLSIPASNFPGGVASLLLFNGAKSLLSERKVFIGQNNYTVSLKANKKNYAARDKVELNLLVKDANDEPLPASLNISVQDERMQTLSDALETDTLQPAASLNEWLTNHPTIAPADVDMLMIAQPAQFNNWATYHTTNDIDTAMEDNEQTELLTHLHGQLTGRHNKPLKGMVVTEILQNQHDFFFEADTTNAAGKFSLPIPQGRDSLLLNLQVTEKGGYKDTDNTITIDRFTFPTFATPAAAKQKFTAGTASMPSWQKASYADILYSNASEGWLKPVIVRTVTEKKENYDASKRSDPLSSIITSDMLQRGGYQNFVGNALLMVPGVSLSMGWVTIYGGDGRGGSAKSEPMLIVDGAPMPNAGIMSYLNGLNWREIDFIEVLTGGNAAIYGMRGGNGVVIVNTKTRYQQSVEMENGFKLINPVTYHVAPAFTIPNYADKLIKAANTPDTRNTIFWQGGLVTDAYGKGSVSFYTADAATRYVVTVTGLTQHGERIYKRMVIDRK